MNTSEILSHELAARFPLMSEADFAALVADIRANGLRNPILMYQGRILDGRHRQRACQILGIEPTFALFTGDAEAAKREVDSLNLHRRHLTAQERRALVIEELKRDPAQSDRSIAKKAGVQHQAVSHARRNLEAAGAVGESPTRIGADGVAQSATKGGRDTGTTNKAGRRIVLPEGKKTEAERVEEIRALISTGHNREQIAEAVGVSTTRVGTLMARNGIKDSTPRRGRLIDASRIARESVATLTGVAQGLSLVREFPIERDEADELLAELREAMRAIRAFENKLKGLKNGE